MDRNWLHGKELAEWIRKYPVRAREFFFLDRVPGYSLADVGNIREFVARCEALAGQ